MSASPEQSITVDVWAVSDGHQSEFVDALVGLFEHLRALDGFVDGQILKGADPTVFVSYATMRSARDRDAAFLDSEVRAMMREVERIARPSPHSYTLVRRFSPPSSARAGG